MALVARWINWRPNQYRDLFRNCALVQAFLYVGAVTLYAVDTRSAQATFVFMKEAYGAQFLFFGVLTAALALDGWRVCAVQSPRRRLGCLL